MHLIRVPFDLVPRTWQHVRELLERAYATGIGDDTFDSFADDLRAELAQLWLVHTEDGRILAAIGTTIETTPAGVKRLRIRACGGARFNEWKHLMSVLEQFAKDEGCARVRIEGRQGWARAFPEYHRPYVVLERTL